MYVKITNMILMSNMVIGIFTVPIYLLLKQFPFPFIFGVGIIATLAVLVLFFYFLGMRFVGTWAILQKIVVTLPTSFTLSHLVKILPSNIVAEYFVLFAVGYVISTPLIFATYCITRWLYGKKRRFSTKNL